jgi:hypothetical protein
MMAPSNKAEVLNTPLLWSTTFYAAGFGISLPQAACIMSAGLTHVQQLWDAQVKDFRSLAQLIQDYHLKAQDQPALQRMLAAIPLLWRDMLTTDRLIMKKGDHFGIFENTFDSYPMTVCEASENSPDMMMDECVNIDLASMGKCYQVGKRYKLLFPDES